MVNVIASFGGSLTLQNSDHFSNHTKCLFYLPPAVLEVMVRFTFKMHHFNRKLHLCKEYCREDTEGELEADQNSVKQAVFMQNVAKEGGAIKWRNAAVHLLNPSFSENSADYGPDITSYGVRL